MGVPALFSNVVRRHPSVIKTLDGVRVCGNANAKANANANAKATTTPSTANNGYANLYLDSNSIVYDCVHSGLFKTDEEIINAVCEKINSYIKLVRPTETVIVAFDGVAPVAKLENQRNRRYKSEFTKSLMGKAGLAGGHDTWDTTAITPGTPFMSKLDTGLNAYFGGSGSGSGSGTGTKGLAHAVRNRFGAKQVLIKSSMGEGEGEHKIFQFIRDNQEKHRDERTVVYGLDADLIMLSINHLRYCPNLFLFRETPHFIRSLNRNLDPGQLYTLDIAELFAGVVDTLYSSKSSSYRDKRTSRSTNDVKPYDYVFLVSLLGNDYIPHNPAFNIRSGGLDVLMATYKKELVADGKPTGDRLAYTATRQSSGSDALNWRNLKKLFLALSKMEEQLFVEEHKRRDVLERKQVVTHGCEPAEAFDKQLNAIPTHNREKEVYVSPGEPYWQDRYYRALFGGSREEMAPVVCKAYLEALEWTMRYYTDGCPDWRWFYPFSYAPLFSDLVDYVPTEGSVLRLSNLDSAGSTCSTCSANKPVSSLTQLSYVLPMSARHMLPERLRVELTTRLGDKYGTNWEFEWAYCRYFWECHAKMPHIDVDTLERITSSLKRK